MHPGYGLQVLEIQERVYKFLTECCQLILPDVSRESLMQPDIPAQPAPSPLASSETGLALLATVRAEAPYRLPASLDPTRLQGIIAAERSAAEDHIWSLREEPGYFAGVVLDMKEHRLELVPDTGGRRHPLLKRHTEKRFWDRVLGNVVSDAYFLLVAWDEVHRQIVNLQSLMEKYSNKITPENDLPEDLLRAFLNLGYLLEQVTKGPISNLKHGVPASPPLRALFVRKPPKDPNSNMIRVEMRRGLPVDKSRDRLLWMFQTMWDGQQLHLFGLDVLMDEMERMIQDDPKLKELLSPWVMSVIFDLSVISECRRQISLYQPWAAAFEDAWSNRWMILRQNLQILLVGGINSISPLKELPWPCLETRLTASSFTSSTNEGPARLPKPCGAPSVISIGFWERVDKFLVEEEGMYLHKAVRDLLDKRILRRTPEWVEPAKDEKPAAEIDSPEALCKPLSQLYFELEYRTRRTITPEKEVPTKTKVKNSRRSPTSSTSSDC